jgi:hypothetical protein
MPRILAAHGGGVCEKQEQTLRNSRKSREMHQRAPSRPSTRAVRAAGVAVASVAGTAAAGYLVLPLALRVFVGGLMWTLDACVWLAASLSAGADTWTIVSAVGRAVGGALTTPQASVAIGTLVVLGGLALYLLQRLLGSDEESS